MINFGRLFVSRYASRHTVTCKPWPDCQQPYVADIAGGACNATTVTVAGTTYSAVDVLTALDTLILDTKTKFLAGDVASIDPLVANPGGLPDGVYSDLWFTTRHAFALARGMLSSVTECNWACPSV